MDQALIAVAHVLVIGCWLGTDLAVYYLSGAMVAPAQAPEVRQFCLRAMNALDLVPRTALVLTLPLGLSLTAGQGLLPAWKPWVGLLWLASLTWLLLVWSVYKLGQGRWGTRLVSLDAAVRLGVIALCLFLANDLVASAPWLAAKLAIMALIVALGLVIRWQLRRLPALYARLAATGSDQARCQLARLIGQVKRPVWLIWIALIVAAVLSRIQL